VLDIFLHSPSDAPSSVAKAYLTASQNHSYSLIDQVFSCTGDTRDRPKAPIILLGHMIGNEAVNFEAGLWQWYTKLSSGHSRILPERSGKLFDTTPYPFGDND